MMLSYIQDRCNQKESKTKKLFQKTMSDLVQFFGYQICQLATLASTCVALTRASSSFLGRPPQDERPENEGDYLRCDPAPFPLTLPSSIC